MRFIKLLSISSIIFFLSTSIFFISCNSKNETETDESSTENILSESVNNSSTENQNLKSNQQNNKINPASFYDADGTLVKTVYTTCDAQVKLLDGTTKYLIKDTMLKLVAFDGKTATILLPISKWDDNIPVYAKIPVNQITTIYPYFSIFEKNSEEIKEFLSLTKWTGKFNGIFDSNSDIYGELSFSSDTSSEECFWFNSDYYFSFVGNYDIEIVNDENSEFIEYSNFGIYIRVNIHSYDEYDYYEKQFILPISLCDENHIEFFGCNNDNVEGEFTRSYSFPSLQELETFFFSDKQIYNDHYYLDLIKNFLDTLDETTRISYSKQFVKFGIFINTEEYKQIYNDYWKDICIKNQTNPFPYYNKKYDFSITHSNLNESFYKHYVAEVNNQYSKQKTYEETMADFDTLSKFYYKGEELYPYCHIYAYDENTKSGRNIYKKPTENSDCVYTYKSSFYAKITGIGPKDTINGVTSHWVQIVLPRFVWKSMYPEYGWVFGAYVSSPYDIYLRDENEDYFHYCSNSFITLKALPWNFSYDKINVSDYGYDSLFYSPDLYDANENYQTSYYRYLVFNQDERLNSLHYDNPMIMDDLEMEFIRSGVYANIMDAKKEIPEKLYLEEIYNHQIQNAHSMYPVFLKKADNITKKADDLLFYAKEGRFYLNQDNKNSENISYAYPENYIIYDPYNEGYNKSLDNSISSKASLYKSEDGKTFWMVYHTYRDTEYLIHDAITVLELTSQSELEYIDSWVSNTFDILSETKASLIFENNEPLLVVQKLNGTLRSKEEYNSYPKSFEQKDNLFNSKESSSLNLFDYGDSSDGIINMDSTYYIDNPYD